MRAPPRPSSYGDVPGRVVANAEYARPGSTPESSHTPTKNAPAEERIRVREKDIEFC